MDLILLKREYVQDLNEFTTQWREYLFDPNDPDGAILQNLVLNSTAFELTLGDLVYTNPLTGDTYTYDGNAGVTKTAGDGPIFTPPPPDLSTYGLRFVLEYLDWNQDTVREEIYKRNYEGAAEEVDGGPTPFVLTYENGGKVFVPFRGSRATVTLMSNTSKKFAELFDGDERDFYLIHKVEGVAKWTGWITPDNFTEAYSNAPYFTTVNFSDGIGMAKELDFPDANENSYTGTISEKDAICAALRQIGLGLEVRIACNLREDGMDTESQPIEQSFVNMETFTEDNQGEIVPLDCYQALEKMLSSWNAVMLQEDNIWWIVREPELFGENLIYKRFQADGTAIASGVLSLEKTFSGEGIKLHRATLETLPAFKNIAVSQEYGDLLVPNNNFAINGNFDKWTPVLVSGMIVAWKLVDWIYSNLTPRSTISNTGNVRRVSESTGLNEVNNYINIYGVVRSFSDPVGYLESKPAFIRQEVGNVIKVSFKVRCNTYGSDKRLVEAYFNIAVKCGTQWLNYNEATDTLEWTGTETRIRWRVAEVMRWENISIPPVAIPEDGDLSIRLYQIVQVGSVSKVEYVCDFDDVELTLADNPALLNQRIYYKTINDKTFTSEVEEIKIELGDVATVLSQNAKIIDGSPSARWRRASETSVPLAQLIAQEWVNQTNLSRYRLSGGTCYTPLSFLATYEDTVNEAGKKFILTGKTFNQKTGEVKPDLNEIDQTEVSITIRAVNESRGTSGTGQGSANTGGGDTSESPVPPSVPIDLGDQDDVIPIIRDGKFEDSGITATRDGSGDIDEYQFPQPVKIATGSLPDHAAKISQLHSPVTLATPANGLTLSGQELGIGLASSGVTGVLSGTDWDTFNGKIGGTGTTNYIPKFTGAETIGDSALFEQNGGIGVSTNTIGNFTLRLARAIGGASTVISASNTGVIQSGVSIARIWATGVTTASSSTISRIEHFQANGANLGSGSSIGTQWGFNADASLGTNSTTSIGFFGNLASGSNKWNLFMQGTANNYLAGNLYINTTSGTETLDVNGTARIRTINNLGSTPTEVLVPSATGVVSKRTLAEFKSDLGITAGIGGSGTLNYLSKWTPDGDTLGDSQIVDDGTSVMIGTTSSTAGQSLKINGGLIDITNWVSSSGAYDKFSLTFGEARGFGYDPFLNEFFIGGSITVPFKIATDAPSDSFNVLSTGGIKLDNLQTGTINFVVGLSSTNELVKNTNVANKILSINAGGGINYGATLSLLDNVDQPASASSSADFNLVFDWASGDIIYKGLGFQGVAPSAPQTAYIKGVTVYQFNATRGTITNSSTADEFEEVVIVNKGASAITLEQDTGFDGSFIFNSGADITLAVDQAIKMIRINGKWREYKSS